MPLPALPLPPSRPRRRPPELVYASDERPPVGSLLVLGIQHAATAMAFIAYVLVAAHAAELDRQGTQSMVAMTLLGMALATTLQAWGGRWGAGALLVHMPNPFMIAMVTALVAAHGPGGLAMAGVVSGVTAIAMASVVGRLRPLFPPSVVGVVVAVAGISLIGTSVRNALGLSDSIHIQPGSALAAAITLGCIVALSIWGGRLRLMALMIAMMAGVAVSAMLGHMGDTSVMQGVPLLALPHVPMPVFRADSGLLVALVLVAVLSQLDVLGSITMLDKMDDADWKRADMRAVGSGIRANGIADLAGGLFGSFPSCACSANIALAYATRTTSRLIGLTAAMLLAVAAFVPQFTMALTLIPEPVLGAVGLYAAGFLIVSGMELITSRAMDSRGTFAVGLSLSAGLAVMQLPQITAHVPKSMHFLLSEGFVVAGILVIVLNLLLRIGTTQRAQMALHAASPTLHEDITGFVETRGAAWGARRATVQRAALAALEASEAIAAEGGGRRVTGIAGSFDEFNLDLELLHTGSPLALNTGTALATAQLLDGDDSALDSALAQVSGLLLRQLADRVATSEHEGQSVLRLHFEH